MRDVYKEYKQGLITWDEAYFIANNIAATSADSPNTPFEETDYWAKQMESLGVDAAEFIMKHLLGYKQNEDGILIKPDVKIG